MEIFMKRWCLVTCLMAYGSINLALCQVFFTPQDDLTALCIAMIESERTSIYGAMYMFTDKKVAHALINAKKRGVHVEIILDQISMVGSGKGSLLQEHGIPVIVHRTQAFNPYTMALMHHKFFIFGCNQQHKSLVWTGSWNCTLRATIHNDENVIVLDDESIITRYLETFLRLKTRIMQGDV